MGILCFPHLGIVQFAVDRGLVPPEWSKRAVEWAVDQEGRVWLLFPVLPSHKVLEDLASFGVSWQKEIPPLRFSRSLCWAAILPLERCHEACGTQTVLICIPAARMAELARSRFFLESYLQIIHVDSISRLVWGLLSPVSPHLLELWQCRTGLRAYREQAPKRWVEWGYRHPLIDHIPVPRQGLCVIDSSRKVRHLEIVAPLPVLEPTISQELKGEVTILQAVSRVQSFHHVVPLRLRWSETKDERHDPTLWYIPADVVTQFWQQCQHMDQGTLSQIKVACVQRGHAHGWLIWDNSGTMGVVTRLPEGTEAYVADPEIPLLFWPVGWQWRPVLGVAERRRRAGVCDNAMTWVERCSDGTSRCHQVPVGDFQPISSWVEYVVPPSIHMRVIHEEENEETPTWTVTNSDSKVSPERKEATSLLPLPRLLPSTHRWAPLPAQSAPGGLTFWRRMWAQIGRYLRELLKASWKKRRRRVQDAGDQWASSANPGSESASQEGRGVAPAPIPRQEARASDVASWRAGGTLRRLELCQWLLTAEEAGSTMRLAEGWAELARWQQSSGHLQDAALCWLMAVWEGRTGNLLRWCESWWLVELRMARASVEAVFHPTFWQVRPEDTSSGRLAAAFLVRLAVEGKTGEDVRRLLPCLIRLVERHAGEMPMRAVWLAACAASQLCEGDILLLSRWLDQLMQRLTQQGHALDVDVPSFLRFVGNHDPEYLNTACTWLIRQRYQMLDWVMRHPAGPLRVEGLDGETAATGQIAYQMWAWGLAAVGERRRAEVWVTNIRGSCEGLDNEMVAALQCVAAAFRWRMQEVWEGGPPQPLLPADWWAQRQSLSPIARYAVDRLCEHSRILDPFRLSRPLRSWELAPLRGDDPIGERLAVLLERTDAGGVTSEAEELLRMCEQSSDSLRTCRILIALCELAALFPAAILERMLRLVPKAWETLPAAWPDAGESRIVRLTYLRRDEVQCRMIENLARAMVRWPEGMAGPFLAELWRQAQPYLLDVVPVMGSVIFLLADVFRRFRLQRELEELAERCEHFQPPETSSTWEHRLATATVWAALEETDRSDPLLDAARDYLFLPANDDSELRAREYMQAAYSYATALAFLSTRRLGRYEELFQRLRPLPVHGSTNRFWTLQPLRLVDIVVRGVLGDGYRLTPQVQRWLGAQDMRFRQRVVQDLQHYLHAEKERKVSLDP
ncbi:MAG: hypothetical protein KatS3mg107_0118 [Gemmataceae bacterium]|nr:MAG: hypothetical protein KatS3mg107_0118 [Gemmataceae bacterium]